MTDLTIPVTRQKLAIEGRSRRNAVTGKLKAALEAMVWEGKDRKEASEAAGLKDRSVRDALKKPHVVGFYSAELGALRTSKRAKNIHRLDGIADSSKNDMAKVGAIKAMEQIADDAKHRHPGAASPDSRLSSCRRRPCRRRSSAKCSRCSQASTSSLRNASRARTARGGNRFANTAPTQTI
jgi:hypothetical protein